MIGFDKELLSVTVHPEDDEAYDIWLNEIGIPKERIIRLEENFWDIGEGPSGPNTEIFYDRGEAYGNDPNDSELYQVERIAVIWKCGILYFPSSIIIQMTRTHRCQRKILILEWALSD